MTGARGTSLGPRPSVSVVVPFLGTDSELTDLIARLERLEHTPADELIVADNRSDSPAAPHVRGQVTVHPAGGVHSPGFARNRGAAVASGEWLVFIDADTEPEPDLLTAYFEVSPGRDVGILAGGIVDLAAPDPRTGEMRASARHAAARGHMEDEVTAGRADYPYAQTANCAIRRQPFIELGGFAEHARAGEDADLCFRLAAGGWRLERRAKAVVRHRTRSRLGASLLQLARHGAGAAWCDRRHPGSFPPPGARALAARFGRDAIRALNAGLHGERDAATFAALDLAEGIAFELGRHLSNQVRPQSRGRRA